MNLESAPAAPAADAERPEAPGPVPAPPERPHPPRLAPGVLLAWGLAALALVVVALLWQKVSSMQEQLARQSAEASSRSVEARTLARQADTDVRDALGKLAALDGRVSDLAAYRAQMEELVQSVARARDENLAVDLDAALRVAQDQTQLTGSVEPLLAALRTAERRLAGSSDPRLTPVARAVARDLERVKAASIPDSAGLLARLDQLLRQVDELPAANDVGPQRSAPAPRESRPHAEPNGWWLRWWHGVRDEAMRLVRVSRIERPEASLMSPEQVFFLRENLKLRLQGARLGILARQYEAARADLSAAQLALGDYFDPASRRTQAAATLLQQIQASTKSAALPRVDDTLLALTKAQAVPGSGVEGR